MRVIQKYECPITLEVAKSHLRVIDNTEDDAIIAAKLNAAIDIAEKYTNRPIFPKQVEIQDFPGEYLSLEKVQAIERIEYLNIDGDRVILAEDDYAVYVSDTELVVQVYRWPEAADPDRAKAWVTAQIGYKTETLPPGIQAACLLLLGTLYDNISDEVVGRSVSQLSTTAEQLLNLYRIPDYV